MQKFQIGPLEHKIIENYQVMLIELYMYSMLCLIFLVSSLCYTCLKEHLLQMRRMSRAVALQDHSKTDKKPPNLDRPLLFQILGSDDAGSPSLKLGTHMRRLGYTSIPNIKSQLQAPIPTQTNSRAMA